MTTLLVTGGCGFIGSNFIRLQLETYPDQAILNVDKMTYAGKPANLAVVDRDKRSAFCRGGI